MTTEKFVLKFKFDNKLALTEGAWFEACHSFKTRGTSKGNFNMSDNMLEDFVKNFKAGVVRRWFKNGEPRLKINFEHYFDTKAGWIIDVETREKELSTGEIVKSLWVKPQWLADAATAIENADYEYFSIEFDREFYDDQADKTIENVLTGGALTNDPFVMELEPIALSALTDMRENKRKEIKMEKLLKALKEKGIELTADASVDDAVKAIDEMLTAEKADLETKLTAKDEELETVKTGLTAEKDAHAKTAEELTKAKDEIKAIADEKLTAEKDALKVKAIEAMKFSKADCEPEGIFGKLIETDITLAAELLEKTDVRFKTEGDASDSSALTDKEQKAKKMDELIASGKTSTEAYNIVHGRA